MINLLRGGAGVVATVLVLAACGTSGQQASRPSAAQCARARSAIDQAALITAPFAGVTTSHDLAVAEEKLGQLSRDLATGASASFYLVPIGKTERLAGELRLFAADDKAFWAALTASSHSGASPQAVGAAAQRTMRDIRSVRATCSNRLGS